MEGPKPLRQIHMFKPLENPEDEKETSKTDRSGETEKVFETDERADKTERINVESERLTFEVTFEEENSDMYGSREESSGLLYIDGKCILNGKNVSVDEAREAVIKHKKQDSLNDAQKRALGIL